MKTLTLNHSFTPPSLEKINHELSLLSDADDPDQSKFLALAKERDKCIQDYLLIADEQEKQDFVNAELTVNAALVAYAEKSFKASFEDLTGLVRGRKAIKQYK